MVKIYCNADLQENSTFLSFAQTLPQTFDRLGEVVHDARNQLRKVEVKEWRIPDLPAVMIKRYHGLFFFQRIWYTFFRAPKCRRAYNNTVELRRRGFPAVEEVACVEVWTHGLFKYGFFVSKVGRGKRLDNLVISMQEQESKKEIHTIIKQYASMVKELHDHGVLYMDMNCGNVLCERDAGLIDTNRVRFYEPGRILDLETAMPDLILMNPRMGTVECFIGEYLRLHGCYSEEEVRRIRHIQYQRHERQRPFKENFKWFKKWYFRWLAQ